MKLRVCIKKKTIVTQMCMTGNGIVLSSEGKIATSEPVFLLKASQGSYNKRK
jgi:hypothetical protein